jgi:hypothetical protein
VLVLDKYGDDRVKYNYYRFNKINNLNEEDGDYRN